MQTQNLCPLSLSLSASLSLCLSLSRWPGASTARAASAEPLGVPVMGSDGLWWDGSASGDARGDCGGKDTEVVVEKGSEGLGLEVWEGDWGA